MEFMKLAVEEAKIAYKEGNVPVGCVIVCDNKVISKNHNTKNSSNISVYHAEILAIIDACKHLKTWRLDRCEVYVTLKPCDLCTNALAESRVKNVYYLLESTYHLNNYSLPSKVNFYKIDDKFKYSKILSDFFFKIRRKK